MLRFAREFCLITLPFVALSVFFFLGHLTGWGTFVAIVALASLIYIRPRAYVPPPGAAEELEAEQGAAGIGKVGGPV
jgi:hypothetical protein